MLNKIKSGDVKVAVIGLGYVGLPLAVEFGKKFRTVGFDLKNSRLEALRRFEDVTLETSAEELKSAKKLSYSSDIDDLRDTDIFIVTVPTPVDKYNRPDLSPLIMASETVGKSMKKGAIVIYESTVFPGCTEEECVPVLEKFSGMKFNSDFFCGYSPERINPGDKEHSLTKILKITSGSTPEIAFYTACRELGIAVGKDISFIGFEGNNTLQGFNPPPTYYEFDYNAMLDAVTCFVQNKGKNFPLFTETGFTLNHGSSICKI